MSESQISVRMRAEEARHAPFSWVGRAPGGALDVRRRDFWRDSMLRRMLALADIGGALLVGVFLGVAIGADAALWAAFFLPIWLLLAKLHGLYDRDHRSLRHLTVDELPSICTWALSGAVAMTLLLLLTPVGSISMTVALSMWPIAAGSAFALRGLARYVWRKITPPEAALIIGSGALAEATRRKLDLFPDIHVRVVAEQQESTAAALRSSPTWLVQLDRIILACNSMDEEVIAELLALCRQQKIKLSVVPLRGMFGTAVHLSHVADLPVVEYSTWDISRSTIALKRALDLCLALPALVLTAPLFLLIALAVRLETRGPAIFSQQRAGAGGRPFRMYKFRTMVSDAEERLPEVVDLDELAEPMFKLERDPRVTAVGRILRRTSLDELPQLVNVVKGEMSLVGPRPEQVELVERYPPEHRLRLAVKPGLTGPMQVFGRGALTFDERLAVEREYIENLSLGRDLRILAMTVSPLVSGRGAF